MTPLFLFFFTTVASTAGFVIVCVIITAIFLIQGRLREAWTFLFSFLGLILSTTLVKMLLAMPRPMDPLIAVTGYGFPSGHATGVMFLALSVCIMARSLPRIERYVVYIAAILFATAIGMSRVYFNVHTPIQAFGGYAFGALWALIWFWLLRTLSAGRNPEKQ